MIHLLFAAAVTALVAVIRNYRKKAGELEQKHYELQRKESHNAELIQIFSNISSINLMSSEELEREVPSLLHRITEQQNLVRVGTAAQTVFETAWGRRFTEADLPYEVSLEHVIARFERPLSSSTLASVTAILVAIDKRVGDLQLGWRDPLTGLFNRRKFDQALDYELDRATRYKGRVSLVLADIDHFKDYNDKYGHASGDTLLKEVAKILTRHHRREDTAARIGGEEFGIVLPEVGVEGAITFAEQLRQEIESTAFVIGGSEVPVYLTASFGVCCYPDCEVLAQWFYRRADQALYRSKEAGRNRTTSTRKIT